MKKQNYKILIADDEGIVTESFSLIISKKFCDKCTVRIANSGRQVIEVAEEFRPDIILMDIQMPHGRSDITCHPLSKYGDHHLFECIKKACHH